MRTLFKLHLLAMLGLVFLLQGCSVGAALSQPPYVEISDLKTGQTRTDVDMLFGPAKETRQEPPDNHVVAFHEFKSGTPGASRLRVIGYLAGDFFTLGLAELVFWPVELAILKAQIHKGHVAYDTKGNVQGFRIVNEDGVIEHAGGTLADKGASPGRSD